MNNLTALQQAMRIVEKHAHNLFNVYNADSRAFLDEMSKCLELERWQIEQAYDKGNSDAFHGKHKKENYYNETYKGGKQSEMDTKSYNDIMNFFSDVNNTIFGIEEK